MLARFKLVPAVAAVALAIGVAACGSSSSKTTGGGSGFAGGGSAKASTKGPFKVLAVLPESGALAAFGTQEVNALKAAASVVNAHGGMLGRKVVMDFVDDAGTATQAVSDIQSALASGSKPDLVFPGITSEEALPALPILTAAKIPVATVASATTVNNPTKFPYTFTTSVLSPYRATAVLTEIKSKGYKSVGALVTDDALGVALGAALKQEAAKLGLKIAVQSIASTSTNPTPEMTTLESGHPQAFLVDTSIGALTPTVLTTRVTMGWNVPTFLDDTTSDNAFTGLPKAALSGVTMTVSNYAVDGNAAKSRPGFKAFLAAISKFGKPALPLDIYAQPYSTLIAAQGAIDLAKSFDPAKIAAAWERMTTAEVPLWFMTAEPGFTPSDHGVGYAPTDFSFVPVGPRVDGSVVEK